MDYRKMACFLVLVLTLCASSVVAAERQAQPLEVKLRILSGQIKLTRVGQTLADVINKGVPLYSGDLIETLRESRAELLYKDGTKMRLKSRTLVEVRPAALKVFKGKTWYKFTKRGSEFQIETPSLVAGIRGTIFDVAVNSKGKSILSVMEGAVAVRGKASGRGLLLRKGFATHCSQGDELVNAYRFNTKMKDKEWNEADWKPADESDISQRFINYLNLKGEYGSNDPRTQEILDREKKLRQKDKE